MPERRAGQSAAGRAGRCRAAGSLPGGPRGGLHHRPDHRRGWRLHHHGGLAVRAGRLTVRRLLCCLFVVALLCAQQAIEFTCPMDRDVRSKTPGKSPRCGMTLVANLPEPVEYPVELRVDPPQIPSARPIAQQAIEFTCPMDRDVRSKTPGKCPRCGMTLVANLPEPVDYPVELRGHPRRDPR